jgi:hypothetical protein
VRFRVVSWNLDSRPTGQLDTKVELLRWVQPDLALLQELSRPVFRTLIPHRLAHERIHERPRLFSWGVLSTDLSDPRGSDRRLGCAVLGASTTVFLGAQLLDDAPFDASDPERLGFLSRTVAAQVGICGARMVTACSFHARRTASRRVAQLKPVFLTGIARWLAKQPSPILFGMDANAPAVDHPDFCRSSFRWPTPPEGGSGEDQLLGPDAVHGLDDVLRRHLDQNPEELRRIRQQRPDGPLAISYRPTAEPARYDHLWATPDLEVIDVRYLYDEAVAAGSDHALVLADFEV